MKWNAEGWGLSSQPFAEISVDKISTSHIKDYFDLLEKNAKSRNGSNGRGMKEQQKTLINKLFTIASNDFIGHSWFWKTMASRAKHVCVVVFALFATAVGG